MSDTPRTDAVQDSLGGDCCSAAFKVVQLALTYGYHKAGCVSYLDGATRCDCGWVEFRERMEREGLTG